MFSNLEFQKQIDSASPDLITQSLLGPVYSKPVVLRYLESSEVVPPGTELLKLEFGNAQLTSFAATSDLEEVATLSFSNLALTESIVKDPATGALLPGKRTASFNLLNGTATGSSIVNPHPNPSTTITDHTTLQIGGATLVIDSYEWSVNKESNDIVAGNLEVSRLLDQATAGLLFAGLNGQTFSEIILQERQAFTDSSGATVFRTTSEWKYSNAFISEFQLHDELFDTTPPENKLSFGYSRVEVDYYQFDENGNSNGIDLSWSFNKGTPATQVDTHFGTQAASLAREQLTIPVFDFNKADVEKGAIAYQALDWQVVNDPIQAKGIFGSLSVAANIEASTPAILTLLNTSTTNQIEVRTNLGQDRWQLNDPGVTSYRVTGSGRSLEPTMQFEIGFKSAVVQWGIINVQGEFAILSEGSFNQATQKTATTLNFGKAVLETPFELEITDSAGAISEIPILDARSDFEQLGGRPTPGAFEFTSPRGIHSPGLFQATASGAKISSAKLVRYATINGKRTEQYRWEISDTFLTNYTTSLSNTVQNDRESFSLSLDQSKVAVIYRDVDKSSTKSYFAGWDFLANKALVLPSGFTVGPFALPLQGDYNTTSHVKINDDNAAPKIVGYRYDASLPVSNPQSDGKRTVSEASSLGGRYSLSEGPLPTLFKAFAIADKTTSVESLIGRTDEERQSTKLSDNLANTTYSYGDSIDSPLASINVSYSNERGTVTSKHATKTSSPNVTWDLSKNATTNSGGFGGFQFASGTEPTTVLEIPPQATIPGATQKTELKIDSYQWITSNAVFQPVGTKSAPVPLATRDDIAQQVTFSLDADLTNAFPGLLKSLASAHLFPELKITQRRDIRLPSGTIEYLPYREWTLQNVYLTDLTQLTNDTAMSVAGSDLNLQLSVGKVISKFFDYDDTTKAASSFTGRSFASSALNSTNSSFAPSTTAPVSTFSNSVDFITPPVSSGIGNQLASSATTRVIPLTSFFSDEQEPSSKLTYTYTILDNEALFDLVNINGNKELVLDFVNGRSGLATIRVDAMDSFGLVGSDTFQIGSDVVVDFGDAPAPYPTLLADNGAAHVATGPRLGTLRDAEANGQPNASATGDGNDEDGVMFGRLLNSVDLAGVNVTLQNASSAFVDAWIDFNRDGDWDDPGEKILDSIALIAGLQTLNYNVPTGLTTGIANARVRVSSSGGLSPTGIADDGEVEDYQINILGPATVVNRQVFYNRSFFDGSTFSGGVVTVDGANNNAAIDPTKTPLLPGNTATRANYTNYSRGINGIFIDVQNLPASVTANDFVFKVGNTNTPQNWVTAPPPAQTTVIFGGGLNGTDRIMITWPDNAIQKTWLQVTMLANDRTGLVGDEVHYWGNAIGETYDSAANTNVNATDQIAIRNNPRNFQNPAAVDSTFDINKDRFVNATDEILARNNGTNFVNALRLLTV